MFQFIKNIICSSSFISEKSGVTIDGDIYGKWTIYFLNALKDGSNIEPFTVKTSTSLYDISHDIYVDGFKIAKYFSTTGHSYLEHSYLKLTEIGMDLKYPLIEQMIIVAERQQKIEDEKRN
jgi:hypothetical protein